MSNRLEDKILYWDTDPVILWITETFPLKFYGLLFVTGLFLGYFVVKHIYKKERIPTEQLDSLLTYIVLGTVIGARLGHCLFYEPIYYLEHPLEIFLPIKEIGGSYQIDRSTSNKLELSLDDYKLNEEDITGTFEAKMGFKR